MKQIHPRQLISFSSLLFGSVILLTSCTKETLPATEVSENRDGLVLTTTSNEIPGVYTQTTHYSGTSFSFYAARQVTVRFRVLAAPKTQVIGMRAYAGDPVLTLLATSHASMPGPGGEGHLNLFADSGIKYIITLHAGTAGVRVVKMYLDCTTIVTIPETKITVAVDLF